MPEKKLATTGAYGWSRLHQRRVTEAKKKRMKWEKRIKKLASAQKRTV